MQKNTILYTNKNVLLNFLEVNMSVIAKNPILAGFYPDPTFLAVGDDYYIVNSTFSFFPGLPVLHSKDLAHWEQIGNILDRDSQLPLKNSGHSRGLFAPVIRYHEGKYYAICTNVSHGNNFIVVADSIEGPPHCFFQFRGRFSDSQTAPPRHTLR